MRRAFKYKLRMNRHFLEACERTLNSCRDLYNAALAQRIAAYKLGRSTNFWAQSRQLTEARELPEVACVLRSFQENALRRLDRSYRAFFRRIKDRSGNAGFPRFKGYERYDSFDTLDPREFRLEGDRLTVQKLGSCRLRLSRPWQGKPKALTVRREFDGWYAVIVCDEVTPKLLPATRSSVGVDVGIESFATLSTGQMIDNPRWFKAGQERLARAQQGLALKKRGSLSRKRARRLIARIHAKIQRQRDWFHWQESRKLVARFDRIAVENLNVKGLAQSSLAKSIHDAGWSSFIYKLRVKAEEAGRVVVEVSARYTSQDCSGCGKRTKKTLAERWHECECGLSLHRDVNAALNILARAAPGLKTEPLRA